MLFGHKCYNGANTRKKGENNVKKVAAVLMSVLFCVGVFILLFRLSIGKDIRWFLFGSPLFSAVYFLFAGSVFANRLKLNRWLLWLCMNFIGGMCSWGVLLVCFPALLFNGFFLLLLVPMVVISAVMWIVVGLGFLVARAGKRGK